MKNKILEAETLKYNVLLNGQVLQQGVTQALAEHFVTTLPADKQQEAQIVPIASNGQQVLFG